MFGVTTTCVTRVVEQLGDRYDCLVFHATGTGGLTMESFINDGLIQGVLDITTTELADELVGGKRSGGQKRHQAVVERRRRRTGCWGDSAGPKRRHDLAD